MSYLSGSTFVILSVWTIKISQRSKDTVVTKKIDIFAYEGLQV